MVGTVRDFGAAALIGPRWPERTVVAASARADRLERQRHRDRAAVSGAGLDVRIAEVLAESYGTEVFCDTRSRAAERGQRRTRSLHRGAVVCRPVHVAIGTGLDGVRDVLRSRVGGAGTKHWTGRARRAPQPRHRGGPDRLRRRSTQWHRSVIAVNMGIAACRESLLYCPGCCVRLRSSLAHNTLHAQWPLPAAGRTSPATRPNLTKGGHRTLRPKSALVGGGRGDVGPLGSVRRPSDSLIATTAPCKPARNFWRLPVLPGRFGALPSGATGTVKPPETGSAPKPLPIHTHPTTRRSPNRESTEA